MTIVTSLKRDQYHNSNGIYVYNKVNHVNSIVFHVNENNAHCLVKHNNLHGQIRITMYFPLQCIGWYIMYEYVTIIDTVSPEAHIL